MTTRSVLINDKAYTKLDSGTGTAIAMQNNDPKDQKIRIVLSATLPVISDSAFFTIPAGFPFSRDGMTGNMYALSEKGKLTVTVGE